MLLTHRHAEFVPLPQLRHPGERAEVPQEGDFFWRQHESARHQQQRPREGHDLIFAAKLPLHPPLLFRFVGDDPQGQLPGWAGIPLECGGIFLTRIQEPHATRAAHQRHEQFAQLVRDAEAVHRALNFGLLRVPIRPLGRAAGEVGEDPRIIGADQLVGAARPQPERLELAPLAVSTPLAMRRLDHDLADAAALIDVDLVEDFLLAGRGGGRRRLLGQRLSHLVQPRLPIGRGDRRGRRGAGQTSARWLEKFARCLFLAEKIHPQRAERTGLGDEGGDLVRLDLAADIRPFVGGQHGRPQVLARRFGLGRLAKLQNSLSRPSWRLSCVWYSTPSRTIAKSSLGVTRETATRSAFK